MIHFDEKSYTEQVDIDTDSFLLKLEAASNLPKSSAPSPELFKVLFEDLAQSSDTIICIHPSKDLSGTVRSAETARLDFPQLDIRILDTRLVASPLGSVIHSAALWAREGLNADTICQQVLELSKRGRIYFLVATLDYLARGGRIGGASALVGNALKIKPILSLENGHVEPFAKERTFKKALAGLKSQVLKEYPADRPGFMSIMHAGSSDLAGELADYFRDELSITRPLISYLPPAIITHSGPGSIAVGFFS
jgi:DegV family protein with EDD domain